MPIPLHRQTLSLDHPAFAQTLATTEHLLIIQNLDGVCMELVNNPLDRRIRLEYIKATQVFDRCFYVLTNGEHIGKQGLNRIVDQAVNQAVDTEATPVFSDRYLPGLAAGGVQWQNRRGEVSHPGVSEAELEFLRQIPSQLESCLYNFLSKSAIPRVLETYVQDCILDNRASPAVNINRLYPWLAEDSGLFVALQTRLRSQMDQLLIQATNLGLGDSFFVHCAPNLGSDSSGKEIVWFAGAGESGTTDFQLILRGAVKEAGVLMLLNKYYGDRTGSYPLGRDFNARVAPRSLEALVKLVIDRFDPAFMPLMIGVGDTVTSQIQHNDSVKRGGSDRNFLHFIQILGQVFDTGNLTVYVDSSGGELKNRTPLELSGAGPMRHVVQGPSDPADPLVLNVAFPGGPGEYCQVFEQAAQLRKYNL
ncbi:MAG: glucosylglycerol 3-phosphatase [Synechococcales cyanobacterium CRU_2_2]|nr:glucosylglycerol 3-phosphatase [Synechococcales cyanobacterium CRU_2_2]